MPEVLQNKSVLLLTSSRNWTVPIRSVRNANSWYLTAWTSDTGDVLLPVAPFSETAGTFVNTEGRVQSFHATVPPLGEARPAWKVLRVLGTLLGKPGFAFDTLDEVRQACLNGRDVASLLSNGIEDIEMSAPGAVASSAIAEVPIYLPKLVRRAPRCRRRGDAKPPRRG